MPEVEEEDISGEEDEYTSETEEALTVDGDSFRSSESVQQSEPIDIHSSDNDLNLSDDDGSLQSETIDPKLTTSRSASNSQCRLTPPEQLLPQTEKKARRYIERKQFDKAIREFVRCTVLARLVYGDAHWQVARAHTNLATAYLDYKGYTAQAIYHSENSAQVIRNQTNIFDHVAEKSKVTAMLLEMQHTLGRALTDDKKLTEAEVALSKAEKHFQEFSKSSATSLEVTEWEIKLSLAIARLNYKQKKFAVSSTYFDRALELMIKQYGKDSPELIPIYQSLGKVEQSKGKLADHTKAIDHYLQAHSLASANYSEESTNVGDTAFSVALAYANVTDDDAGNSAESYFKEALNIYEKSYGTSHEKTLETQDELARLMIRTDRLDEGVALLHATLPAKEERYGDLSSEVADAWKLIGSSHLSTGDMSQALKALQKVRELQQTKIMENEAKKSGDSKAHGALIPDIVDVVMCYVIECSVFGSNSKKAKESKKSIDMLLQNPTLSGKMKKSKADELKQRPRFSSIAKTASALGGFKPQSAY